MNSIEQFRENLREAEIMTRSAMTEESLRLSGELLAEAAYKLDRSHFESDSGIAVELFSEAAVIHVNALIAADETAAAVSTAIGSLTRISMSGAMSDNCEVSTMMLLNLALNALTNYIRIFETSPSPDVITHYKTVMRYLASMLYHHYSRLNSRAIGTTLLNAAYMTLKNLIDQGVPVDQHEIGVNNQLVDPDNPLTVYTDTIGRLRAVGFEF